MSVGPECVQVVGSGQVDVRPDAAVLDLGAESWAGTVAQAMSAASAALVHMTDALRSAGLTDQDLRTEGPSTHARTDETGRIAGYVCSFHLTARVPHAAVAADLVADALSRAGDAARVHGIRYTVTDRSAAQREARSLALTDARSRAEQLAALVGRPLGRAIDIVEREDDGGWQPERMMAVAVDSAAGEPGVQRIGVRVQVRWAFAD